MKTEQFVIAGLLAAILLTGASCGPTQANPTTIGQAVLASGVKTNNEPVNDLEQVGAGTGVLYLAAQVIQPIQRTAVRVAWYKLPDQVMSSEDFDGQGNNSLQRYNFNYHYGSSWLASRLAKPGASWPLGEYRVEISLNQRLAKTVFFTVVSDVEADRAAAAKVIQSLAFGDTITGDNQIINAKNTFSRDADNIYIQLQTSGAQSNTDLQVSIRYVKDDQIINTFAMVISGDQTKLFTLSRERFGKLWSDKLWPVGTFTVTTQVNGIVAKTADFFVKAL